MPEKLITTVIAERLENPEPLLLDISRILRHSVMRNFETESDGKRRWARLAKSTQKQRAKKGYTGKILQRTGTLKRSIYASHGHSSGGGYAEVGTNLKYAAALNFGAVMHRSSLRTYLRRKKKGKKASYSGKNKMSSWRIPARPFLTLRPKQKEEILNAVSEWMRGE